MRPQSKSWAGSGEKSLQVYKSLQPRGPTSIILFYYRIHKADAHNTFPKLKYYLFE